MTMCADDDAYSNREKKPFNEQAAILINTAQDLIKQVLVKHSAAVLQEMHDQIVTRNERIRELERDAALRQPPADVRVECALNECTSLLNWLSEQGHDGDSAAALSVKAIQDTLRSRFPVAPADVAGVVPPIAAMQEGKP